MAFFVTSFAIAGSRVSLTGGLYAYVEVAFGRYVGFSPACFTFSPRSRAVAGRRSLADSIGALAPIFAHGRQAFAGRPARLSALLAFINIRGVRAGARRSQRW